MCQARRYNYAVSSSKKTINKCDKSEALPENQQDSRVIDTSLPQLEKVKSKPKNKKNNVVNKVRKKNFLNKVHNSLKDACSTNDENSRPGEEVRDPPRSASRDQMSDASSHASLERGYMCDSESGDERGSEADCDLFNSKVNESNFISKKNSPQNCRSPPVLPPIHPVQNGTHHPEPSTAVAAVTASVSPANTVSALVVSAASPREPQIGSPAVVPISCSSPASPPAGVVPASPPPYLHQRTSPTTVTNKEASSSKLISNGYEFVSDTSPPSPIGGAKLLSPNKFLHKRVPPVSSCRETVTAKPAINVYDFVSDHSAPSSPDGVIFLSQSKFHHKGVAPLPAMSKDNMSEKMGVSNGHSVNVSRCVSSPAPVLTSIPSQNSHKGILETAIKTNVSLCKTEPLPTVITTAGSEHRPLISPGHSRSSSYAIPYSTSQTHHKTSSPLVTPLSTPVLLSPSAPSLASSMSTSSVSAVTATPVSTRASITVAPTTTASAISHPVVRLSCSPVVTTSHPNTPTPVPARDTHSSHSNSSLSSLSQLSMPIQKEREGTASRSHSNSSNNTPSVTGALTNTSAYAATSSLASLVFSKPQTWGSNSSGSTQSTAASHSSSFPPRSSPSVSSSVPLPPTLPSSHHTSPFGTHPGPPPPPLLPVASHHAMFASPIPPGSLTPTLPIETPSGPSPYRGDSLFPQPNPDLLRRELDTRFLASQDHSIPIPPPPYMQTEVQHGHIHQQPPFMPPPPLAAPLVSQPTPHLYEKYPKLDSALYGRPSIGLSGFPTVSSLFAPGGGGASTPFAPPAHISALQPKINSVPKTKTMKPGKWCAMHVRIAWEIYNHQQKQKRAEAHKAGAGIPLASVKPPTDPLHPANHLFSALPRQHDLSPFSSSLMSAASAHPRAPFEASSHHSTFLNPSPAHMGVAPFARPSYPGFGAPGPGFTSLGPLGIPGAAMLGTELRGGCLTQDPWTQRTGLTFAGGAPWGGLKEDVEHDRLQQERKREEERLKRAEQERREKELERERREQERREQERREMERREQERKEQERKEKERREQERREMERREMERREQERREQERREQERQKERDREIRLQHQLTKSAIVLNGDIRDHHHHHHHHPPHPHHAREWERPRDIVRSPVQVATNPVKYDSALERHVYNSRLEVKVKQERKDDEPIRNIRTSVSGLPGTMDDRVRKRPSSIPQGEAEAMAAHMSRTVPHGSVALGLNSLEHARVMGPHGLVPSPAKDPLSHSQTSPLWGPLTPSPTVTTLAGTSVDHFRTREMLQGRAPVPEPDRRFDPLASVMSPRDRCSNSAEFSRQISTAMELEQVAAAAAAAYDRSKLLPPPLRANESPYMTPPALPPASASSFFSPPVSPYLNSLCSSSSRTKAGAPPVLNGIPPPLIPCTFPVQNHTGFPANRTSSPMAHKLAAVSASNVLNLHEQYFAKDRREVNGHPSDLDAHLRL